MKNKYLTTLILALAITSALTGCANGPLAKKAVKIGRASCRERV